MDYGSIPATARYRYECGACRFQREGLLDHPGYDWRCPECGGPPKVTQVTP